MDLAGLGSLLGGIGSLFGGKSAGKETRKSTWGGIMGQAQGARDAAFTYGFNPLTLLGASAPVSAGGGGVPPLASIDLIVDGLRAVDDQVSGDADRRRAAEQMRLDLAKIELDQARNGVVVQPPPRSAAASVGGGAPMLGSRPIAAYATNGYVRGGGGDEKLGRAGRSGDQSDLPDHLLGDVAPPDPKLDRASPAYVLGFRWDAVPGFSPGEVWENRYGDTPLNWPIAAAQLSADVGFNAHKAQNHAVGMMRGAGPVMSVGGREFAMEKYVTKAERQRRREHEERTRNPRRFDPNHRDGYYRAGPF